MRVVRMIDKYEDDGRFHGWLFRIAANHARDRVRQIARTPGTSSLGGEAGGGASKGATGNLTVVASRACAGVTPSATNGAWVVLRPSFAS